MRRTTQECLGARIDASGRRMNRRILATGMAHSCDGTARCCARNRSFFDNEIASRRGRPWFFECENLLRSMLDFQNSGGIASMLDFQTQGGMASRLDFQTKGCSFDARVPDPPQSGASGLWGRKPHEAQEAFGPGGTRGRSPAHGRRRWASHDGRRRRASRDGRIRRWASGDGRRRRASRDGYGRGRRVTEDRGGRRVTEGRCPSHDGRGLRMTQGGSVGLA